VRKRAQSGVAVLVAMMIAALAASVAVMLTWRQEVWIRQAENLGDRSQADAIARAGIDFGRRVLLEDAKQNDKADTLKEDWHRGIPPVPVENGTVSGLIDDAQGLYNLNNAVDKTHIAQLRRLLEILNLQPDLANAVADWVDGDTETRFPGGAEDLDYLGLTEPYRAANRGFVDVEELIRLKGFDAKTVDALRPFVTALPTMQPTPINVNTAAPEVLAAVLYIDLGAAKSLAEKRDVQPFTDQSDFTNRAKPEFDAAKAAEAIKSDASTPTPTPDPSKPGAAPPAASTGPQFGQDFDVQSQYFLVNARATFGRSQAAYTALVARQQQNWPTVVWSRRQID